MSNPDQYIIPSPEKIVSHNYAEGTTLAIQIISHDKEMHESQSRNINLILGI